MEQANCNLLFDILEHVIVSKSTYHFISSNNFLDNTMLAKLFAYWESICFSILFLLCSYSSRWFNSNQKLLGWKLWCNLLDLRTIWHVHRNSGIRGRHLWANCVRIQLDICSINLILSYPWFSPSTRSQGQGHVYLIAFTRDWMIYMTDFLSNRLIIANNVWNLAAYVSLNIKMTFR